MIPAIYFAVAFAAGLLQAMLLRRRARARAHPVELLVRLVLVVVVLVWAALSGHILAGALGWAAGFGATSIVLLCRWT